MTAIYVIGILFILTMVADIGFNAIIFQIEKDEEQIN